MNHNLSQPFLYHGSPVADLKVLKPNPHNAVNKKAVVFATTDIRFALAMIHGTGEEIAVGYFFNKKTNEEQMYIHELQPGKLKLLEAPGYIYQVNSEGFQADPNLSHIEFFKESEAVVIKQTTINNVLSELLKYTNLSVVEHKNVPTAMQLMGRDISKPKKPHAPDRFKDI
ncbi:MAG TPA: hypothetical protein PKD37_03700 [Oligoflexia bacterium]|nr:hypothetical protein [Oligoflexia bacterium]HMP27071.1 hypothetical protein [Oligoflexia bacterium]